MFECKEGLIDIVVSGSRVGEQRAEEDLYTLLQWLSGACPRLPPLTFATRVQQALNGNPFMVTRAICWNGSRIQLQLVDDPGTVALVQAI